MSAQGRGTATVLLVLVGCSVALKGGVHPRHGGWITVGLVGLAVFSLIQSGPLRRPKKATQVLMGFIGLGVALQLVPLPAGVRATLSPGTQSIYEDLGPADPVAPDEYWNRIVVHDLQVELGEASPAVVFDEAGPKTSKVSARPVSVDPFRTRWVLTVWLSAFCIWTLGRRAIQAGASGWLIGGLSVVFVGEAVFGLLQMNGQSLGFFPKTHYFGSATGTLVNRNHFGSLMLLGTGVLGTAAFTFRAQRQRAAIVGAVLCVAALIASQSRAAIFCGLVAFVIFAGLAHRRRVKAFERYSGVAYGAAFALAAVGWLLLSGRIGGALVEDPSLQGRMDAMGHAIGEWRGFLFAGAGVGAFGSIATLNHSAPYTFHFEHLHNDYLQFLIEGGVLIGAPLLVLLLVSYVRHTQSLLGAKGFDARLPIALGLGACLLHAFVDFPLQIPGIVFLIALLLAVMEGPGRAASVEAPSKRSTLSFVMLAGMLFVSVHSIGLDFLNARTGRLLHAQSVHGDSLSLADGVDTHLQLQRRGARRQMGRLALARAEHVLASQERKKAYHAFLSAADTARHAIANQPLSTDEYLSAAIAFARASQISRQLPPSNFTAEELGFASDAAQRQALVLQPTNPNVFLDIAKAQTYLAKASPLAQGHYQRAVNALSEAIRLEPRSAERAFRIASSIPSARSRAIEFGVHPIGLYEAARHWLQHGDPSFGDTIVAKGLELHPTHPPLLFLNAERIRAKEGEQAAKAAYALFVEEASSENGLKAWAYFWTGQYLEANTLFRRLLLKNPESAWLRTGLKRSENQLR